MLWICGKRLLGFWLFWWRQEMFAEEGHPLLRLWKQHMSSSDAQRGPLLWKQLVSPLWWNPELCHLPDTQRHKISKFVAAWESSGTFVAGIVVRKTTRQFYFKCNSPRGWGKKCLPFLKPSHGKDSSSRRQWGKVSTVMEKDTIVTCLLGAQDTAALGQLR